MEWISPVRSKSLLFGIFARATGRFIQLSAGKVIVGSASPRTPAPITASGAFAGQCRWGKPTVIGKRPGIVPDITESSFPQVSFNKEIVIHGLAAPHIPHAVNTNAAQSGPTAQKGRSDIPSQALLRFRIISDVIRGPDCEAGLFKMLLNKPDDLSELNVR